MNLYDRLERMTRRWWFYLAILCIQFLPPYTTRGTTSFNSQEMNRLVGDILSHAFVLSWVNLSPLFKVLPLAFLVLLVYVPRSRPFFSLFAALHYLVLAFFQNMAFLEDRGLAILTNNVVMITLVALSFLVEVFVRKNMFAFRRVNWKKGFLIGMAAFAFLYPVDPVSFRPDFHMKHLFTNAAGLTFCMMTPLYLTVLLFTYPEVNLVTLRVTGLVGTIIGLYNLSFNFFFDLPKFWWNGILHIPLLLISLYAFVLSFQHGQRRALSDPGTTFTRKSGEETA
uniref:Uncharacterized protein n=1 Tax=Candidatus Caldatribacterium californiense TaxID=1454726 RepID=A0A7V3YG66_9BACT